MTLPARRRSCFPISVSTFAAVLVLLQPADSSLAQTIPGKFYEYRILSTTGQTPLNANQPLTGIFGPSINANGVVAYSAEFNGGGQGVVAASPTLAPAVVSFANPTSGRGYGVSVQINSAGKVLASDFLSGSYFDRLWNVTSPGTFKVLIRSGSGQPYSSVLTNGCVNSSGDAVMPALDHEGNLLVVSYNHAGTVAGQLTLPVNSFPFPQIADNGSILVRLGQQANSPVKLYDQSLTTVQVVIADSTNFDVIGNQPGLSSDGSVVAFYGQPSAAGAMTLGASPGIFAAVNNGAGWNYVRVTGINAELGYNDAGKALSFSSYANDSRVAVVNLGLGAAGIADDSFVVSFIGTPSGASRTNPVIGAGVPLLFSSQQGLWTIRVDAEKQLSPPNNLVFHPRTAIPAVQIGDTIGGNVISSISVFNQLANAAQDDTGAVRTMRRGDHRVVFQAATSAGQQLLVRGSHLDSDQDGLLDHWETTGIDMDQDGVVDLNLAAMGANPNKRDLFIEIDWLSDLTGSSKFQPSPGVVSPAPGQMTAPFANMFAKAPALAGNLYGVRSDGRTAASIPAGITVHIDGGPGADQAGAPFSVGMGAGPLEGGDTITAGGAIAEVVYFGLPNSLVVPGVTTRAFQDAKDAFFGHADKDGRELAFHYVIFGDFYDVDTDGAGGNSWSVASATANSLTSASALPSLGTGDVVKITAGSGAGQLAGITAVNAATKTLTLQNNWTTTPNATSTFSVLSGSTGRAEVFINPSPDFNSLPGNDLIVAMGGAGAFNYVSNGILGTPCLQWRTLAHELGHTLGLRHGGIDNNAYKGNNYLSIMSYSWQLGCNPVSPVQSYSVAGDPTFDDWASLQHDFPDVEIHLGDSLGLAFGSNLEFAGQQPEPTALDYMNQNGPPDNTAPVVQIQTPAANANVGLTLPLQVTVNATDNNQVASVTVSFDANGNGNTNDSGEMVLAKFSSGTTYKANFAALSGPAGARKITASAIDSSGNTKTVTETVNVVVPNPVPSLASLDPNSATHGGAKFTLTVNGANFVSGAFVQWNGANRSTTFVNSGKLTATIPASDIATAGTAQVKVKNPGPGGGTSNALPFTIN